LAKGSRWWSQVPGFAAALTPRVDVTAAPRVTLVNLALQRRRDVPIGLSDAPERWIALVVTIPSGRRGSDALARCMALVVVVMPSDRRGSDALARCIALVVVIPSDRCDSLRLRTALARLPGLGAHRKLSLLEGGDEQLHRFEMKLSE
jgi:hypothetical protein